VPICVSVFILQFHVDCLARYTGFHVLLLLTSLTKLIIICTDIGCLLSISDNFIQFTIWR